MAKTTVGITIDSDIVLQLKSKKINVSGTINQFLHQMLKKQDISSGSQTKIEKHIDRLNLEITNINKKYETELEQLTIELLQNQNKLEQLKQEQKEAEAQHQKDLASFEQQAINKSKEIKASGIVANSVN
jgi:DNA repair ATPase RecN